MISWFGLQYLSHDIIGGFFIIPIHYCLLYSPQLSWGVSSINYNDKKWTDMRFFALIFRTF
jgi:hypothetical protein